MTITEDLRHERAKEVERIPLGAAALLARSKKNALSAISRRRSAPIRAYIGPNGGGKTLCMVRDVLPSLDAGRAVCSTVPLYSAPGVLHPSYVPFTSWHQLLRAEHTDFILDEISGVASSRDYAALHPEVINALNQLRKPDNTVSWSGPAWARSDKVIREVTQLVVECRGYMQDRSAVKGEDGALWAPRRLFRYRGYDMREFDEWSAGKREKMHADVKEWFWGPGSRAFASYETLNAVGRIEPYDPRVCETCGKRRREEYCKGHA
jgi:hypothetical protein